MPKMAILPKHRYLFRVLPTAVQSYFLRIVQCRVMTFVWDASKLCFPKSTLLSSIYLSKLREGLGLPNFSVYYWVAHLANLRKYHAVQEIPLWVAIEVVTLGCHVDSYPISMANLLCFGSYLPSQRYN